jgi:hypothetical protein
MDSIKNASLTKNFKEFVTIEIYRSKKTLKISSLLDQNDLKKVFDTPTHFSNPKEFT